MVGAKDVLVTNSSELSSISQDTAAGSEEVAASIEETTASMEQLNQMAFELESYAREINDEIRKFTLKRVFKKSGKNSFKFLRQLVSPLLTYTKHTLRCSRLRFLELLCSFCPPF
ncbi:hypothetical protein ACOI1C_06825 [Bacillus sp. DJP31]|uniref:hypothetical protein n=1 Tax=Bacillus sp. DJP31 TaxID=3409789 RepID=UPI003BB5E048